MRLLFQQIPILLIFCRFLVRLLEIEEAVARWKKTGSDTRITSNSEVLDEYLNFNPDQWSDERSYDYTIVSLYLSS